MEIKQYQLFKSAKKTAEKNNLVFSKEDPKKTLLDFSVLDALNIPSDEREIIMEDFLQTVLFSTLEEGTWYYHKFSPFRDCVGSAYFVRHNVYDEHSCNLRYRIFQLVALKHTSETRSSVYDDFKPEIEINYNSGYRKPLTDYEI